jgi:hypothetical protein
MQPNDISAVLGSLSREDGTGEIPIGIRWQTLFAKLKELGISYEKDGYSVQCSDGTSYYGDDRMVEDINLMQTTKGLRVGDPVGKVLELYGEISVVYHNDLWYYAYRFAQGIDFHVGADGDGKDATVTFITISKIPSWANESFDGGE